MRKVTIIHEVIPQYRIPFFEGLRMELARQDVELRVLVGHPPESFAKRGDMRDLAWAEHVPQWNFRFGKHDLAWQRLGNGLAGSDLVIALAQVRQLAVFGLLFQQAMGWQKVAFFGHGRDFSKPPSAWSERLKATLSRRVHWWFAYNNLSARVVEQLGYPAERITPVMNAVDTAPLQAAVLNTQKEDILALRTRLGLRGSPVGLYIGALAPIKGIPYLLESALAIRTQVPGFEFIVVGNGPQAPLLRNFAQRHPWVHPVPGCFDGDKASYLKLADIFLMPFGVGLGILDTFVGRCPLVTTDHPGHGPEVDYLEPGINGLCVSGQPAPAIYARAVAALLDDPASRSRLQAGCTESASRYRMDTMISRFANGILCALEAAPLNA